MRRALSLALAASSALLLLLLGVGPPGQASGPSAAHAGHAARSGTAAPAHLTVVQAVPGATVDVSVDGRSVAQGAVVGDLLGPFDLAAGSHEVTFTGDGMEVATSLDVTAGDSTDVVLHLPAEVGGDPVVHSYAAPTGEIGPGKARVVLAHTATVAPADVEVNGETVFTNIANGEYAEAEVPAGTHEVALLPTGGTGEPILGPLEVPLDARTLSMIYAYGNPRDGSMNVIAHTSTLAANGAVRPTTIDTGSAGLAGDLAVTAFHPGR